MSKSQSMENHHSGGRLPKMSATSIRNCPSLAKGKRPHASGQSLVDGPHPLRIMKKPKLEKEVTLHTLLPNAASIKFTADVARIHSVKALLDLVQEKAVDHHRDWGERARLRSVEWGPQVKLESSSGDELKNESMITLMTAAKNGSTIILIVQDGHKDTLHSDPNMWNVTPKPEMLGQLPQGYTLETALADQVDNALQAVWHNDERRLVSVHLSQDQITIFDTGQGMDGSHENCIANWGTVGGSTHREVHHMAIGGKPPFLKPYLGKYGAGAVAAALHLGGCVNVWSKTRQSNKVVSLVLRQKELVQRSRDEPQQRVWRTAGGFRDMTNEEREMSPHGSFTRVEITKLKKQYSITETRQQTWEVENVRQLLKEIYYPYIQSEEGSSSKTIFPVDFEVNGTNLLEVTGCETAISKLHTCNGDPFVVDIHLTKAFDGNEQRTSKKAATIEGANVRISCQYYPNLKGKEALETVAEQLHLLNPRTRSVNFETMNRVSVRWLGRLLPEVKWPIFPFMVAPVKEQRLGARVWAKRVLAFVDTDAGFHPVQSKTDLDRDQPFVVALRHMGESVDKTTASGVNVFIKHSGKEIKPSQLADLYLKWLKNMHVLFDEEFVFPDENEAQFIFNQGNCLKHLGVGPSQLLMFHTHMKDSKHDWNIDDNNPLFFKLPKGPGLKVGKYVTLEYFFHDAVDDERGFQVKFLCRGIEVDTSEGCQITSLEDGTLSFELKGSEWFPATLLNTAKRLDAGAWKRKTEEILNKSPGFIEVLKDEDAQHFVPCEAFPDDGSKFEAGFSLPTNFLVVVRPRKGCGASFKQGMIVPEPMEIKLTVTHGPTNNDHNREVYNLKYKSTVNNGVKGLYMFGSVFSEVNHLLTKGSYSFKFELESDKYKDVRPAVSLIEILPSTITAKWTFCNHLVHCVLSDHENTKDDVQPIVIRLYEPVKENIFLQKYDEYGNSQEFETSLELDLFGVTSKGDSLEMHTKAQSSVVAGTREKERLLLQDIVFANASLEQLGSTHEALLRVCLAEEQLVHIKCKVLPGALAHVDVTSSEPPILMRFIRSRYQQSLQPGEVIRNLTLQGLDSGMNKVEKGQKLHVSLEGIEFQDDCGEDRVVDENGKLQLGGLLKVTCNYNSTGSIAFHSDRRLIFSITFKTVTRRLVLANLVPVEAYVGRAIKGISVKMVDDFGNIDMSVTVNHSITVDWQHGVTYPFLEGVCLLPSIQMPEKPGAWKGIISFTADPSLCVTLRVELKLAIASSVGPARTGARKGNEVLTAECGMPIIFPFKAYDDHQNPALLSDSQREHMHVSFEPNEDGDSYPVFRSITVDQEEVKLFMVDSIPTYEAHILVSGSAGMYMMTLAEKSLTCGKAQTLCRLEHGRIAQLVLARSDGIVFQDYEDSDEGPLAIIEVKKNSHLMPELTVTLLDYADNVCSSCDKTTLKVRSVDLPDWKVPVIKTTRGIGKLQCSDLEASIGRYHVVIELEMSTEEASSLEEQTRPVQAQFSLRVNPGNNLSKLRLLGSVPVSISLTDEKIQYVPPMSILAETADGLRLESRPKVGVKLFGDCFKSGPKEYFGDLVESCNLDVQTGTSSPLARYEFTQVCAPCQAGTYRMDFFVLDSDVHSPSQNLIVGHGPPRKILIARRVAGLPINVLKVKIVDAYGNLCENLCNLRLDLELTLRQPFTESPGQSHSKVFCNSSATVRQGNGDFGVLQLTKCIPGYYCLKVFPVHDEQKLDLQSLISAEGKVCVIRGNIDQSQLQLCNQNREYKVIDECGERLAKCRREIQQKQVEIQAFESRRKNLEANLKTTEHRRNVLMTEQHAENDVAIIQAEATQPVRNYETIKEDIHRSAGNNNAPLAFFEAFSGGMMFSQYPGDFLGLVVMLAQVEDHNLNRRLAEFLGPSSLLLIISRTQRAVDGLEVYDAHGQVDEYSGLHGFARSRNYKIFGTFQALALTDLTPYRRVKMQHSQRILDINPPLLPSGQVPEGFLGYAVNLLYLRPEHIQMRVATRSQGDAGLRESLFFHLFRFLQVYDTRHNLNYAKEHVNRLEGGAISLDGGTVKSNFQQQLGRRRSNASIRFGSVPFDERAKVASLMPPASGSFERMRNLAALERDITTVHNELSSLVPTTNETIRQLTNLTKNVSNDKKQLQVANDSSKRIQNEIVQLQKKHAGAAKNGLITGKDRPNSQGSEKMQAIWM